MNSTKEERIHGIMDAACKVFASHGFEKSKIEDIAKAAGIGKSTVYEYFDSKMTVFMKLFESGFNLYRSNLTAIAKRDAPLREKLLDYLRENCHSINTGYRIVFMHLHETMFYKEMRSYAYEQYTFVHELLVSCLNDAVKKGEIRPDVDLECVCFMIYGAVQRLSLEYIFGQKEPLPDGALSDLVDSMLNVISVPA